MKLAELDKHVGRSYPVLWEQRADSAQRSGYTPHFHKVVASINPGVNPASGLEPDVTIDALDAHRMVLCHNQRVVTFGQQLP
jgi:hypothetical protein